MKFKFKYKPEKRTSKFTKVCTALSIGIGVVLLVTNYTDSETTMLLSATVSSVTTFFIV